MQHTLLVSFTCVGVLLACRHVLCDKILPRDRKHTCLLTPNREPTTDWSKDTINIQTWWTSRFYWCCLQDNGWGVTYRGRKDSKTAVSPSPLHWGWEPTKLGTWSSLHSLQAAHQVGGCLFQVPQWPKLASSRQFLFSLQLTLAGRGLVNLLSFREFLKLLCCCLCLCLRSSHTGCFYHTGDSYTTACLLPMGTKRGCQTPWNWS